MKIVGLFIVVFVTIAITRTIGFSVEAQMIGAIVGAGSFVLMNS